MTGKGTAAPNDTKIRVGMIGVDNHAYWFAPLMDADCDALKLREVSNHVHCFLTDSYCPTKFTAPRLPSFSIERIWGAELASAERFSEVFGHKPKVCRSFEDVGDGVDLVFINSCGSDGSEHLKFATPHLMAGRTVFVDKPLAFTYREAVLMQQLSVAHHAPLMSSSLLSLIPEAPLLRMQAEQMGGAKGGYVRGYPGWATPEGLEGIIHGLSLVQNVFGVGFESVHNCGLKLFEYMLIRYPGGLEVLLNNYNFDGTAGCYCDIYTAGRPGRSSDVRSSRIDINSYLYATHQLLVNIRDFAVDRRASIPLERMMELIRAIDAARLSHRERRWVLLNEVD